MMLILNTQKKTVFFSQFQKLLIFQLVSMNGFYRLTIRTFRLSFIQTVISIHVYGGDYRVVIAGHS